MQFNERNYAARTWKQSLLIRGFREFVAMVVIQEQSLHFIDGENLSLGFVATISEHIDQERCFGFVNSY